MKLFFIGMTIALSLTTQAQVTKVSLQASGLTCSMCSNSIYKALKTLDFVDHIEANVKTYTFELTFKPGRSVDFDRIRKKVEGAGFGVSGFMVTIQFNNVPVKKDQPVNVDDKTFLFVNAQDGLLNGLKEIKLLDKGFVASNESKRNSAPVLSASAYHASIN